VDVKKKLSENLAEAEDLFGKSPKTLARTEPVTLWKDDYTSLYVAPAHANLETALLNEKINGLITGQIQAVDDYAAVTASLRVFPGTEASGEFTEVGRLSESDDIARRLAVALFSSLVKTVPAQLEFEIGPAEVLENVVIYVDDMTYTSVPESAAVHPGIHSVSIAAQGYRTESFSLNFEESKSYVIHVEMSEATLEKVTLAMKEPAPGFFFINAEKMEESQSGAIVIETKSRPILGRFDFVGGHSQYFYIPQVISRRTGLPEEIQPADWAVNPKNRDAAARIELSRKIMYASYTAMMVSLPLLFFAMGEYQLRANAVMGGLVPYDKRVELYDEARTWYTIQNVCIGVSATLGVNFLTQLIIYLVRANATLPERARIK
jgi:hypothetical protein